MSNASEIMSKISMHKMYNSNLYANASHAICAYSYMLGKTLHGYSEIDAAVSAMLQSSIYSALQGEQRDDVDPQMAIKAIVLPVVFAEPNYSPQSDPESETLQLIMNLNALETHTFQVLEQAAQEPAAGKIDIISIPGLVAGSKFRIREIRRLFGEIQSGAFWTKTEPVLWLCLQCGLVIKSSTAFEECSCCGATREFATVN